MNVPPGGPPLLKSVTYSLLIFALISNALLIIYVNFMYAQLSGRARLSQKSSEKILSGRTGMIEFGIHKELSESYREGTAQKLKSMALPYKTKVRKK